MKKLIVLLVTLFNLTGAFANEKENGVQLFTLEGFEDYAAQSAEMKKAITEAANLIKRLNLDTNSDFPELEELTNEIQFAKYILSPKDVAVSPNRAPGDYPVGGFLVASTETYRGAPTKIYPKLITKLSSSQLVQMVIHEALHRTLPSPMNENEEVVTQVTNFLTQFSPSTVPLNLKKYFAKVSKQKIPWIVYTDKKVGGYTNFDGFHPEQETYAFNFSIMQESLNPLISDYTLVETQNETRIKIFIECDVKFGKFTILVLDKYKGIRYNYIAKNLNKKSAKNNVEVISEATQFIRDSIKRIQDGI